MSIGFDELSERFGSHKATTEGDNPTAPDHIFIRNIFTGLAGQLDQVLEDNVEKAEAIKKLEEAAMWANKSIARRAPLEVNVVTTEQEIANGPVPSEGA